MEALLILPMVLLYTMQNFFTNIYSGNYPGKPKNAAYIHTICSGIITVIVCFCFVGIGIVPELLTVLFAAANAAALILYNVFIIKCSQTGPYSILMVFNISGGILIPIIVNSIFFNNIPTWQQFIALSFVLFSVYLISNKKNESKVTNKGFFPSCIGLGICNGLYGTLLNVQQVTVGVHQKESMVACTFLFGAISAFVILAIKEKGETFKAFKQNKSSLIFMIAAGLSAAFAVFMLSWILTLIDPNLVYTFDCAGVFLMSIIASAVILKEKLSTKNIIGCVIMCIALVCVSVFER